MAYKDINKFLHDFLLDEVFTPENADETKPLDFFKRGEKVRVAHPEAVPFDTKGDFEIIGFYDENDNIVPENPYNDQSKSWKRYNHGVRLRNLKTNKEIPVQNHNLERIG